MYIHKYIYISIKDIAVLVVAFPPPFYAVLIATSVTAVYAYINFKIAGKWQRQWIHSIPHQNPKLKPKRRGKWNIYFYFYYIRRQKLSQHTLAVDACRVSVWFGLAGILVGRDEGSGSGVKEGSGCDTHHTHTHTLYSMRQPFPFFFFCFICPMPPLLLLSFSAGSTLMVVRKH